MTDRPEAEPALPGIRAIALSDADLWEDATTSSFLDGARDGSLDPAAFATWLQQDRLFLVALTRAWARLLVHAPAEDHPLLAGGISAFVDEVRWLDAVSSAAAGGRAAELPATAAYNRWLAESTAGEYALGLAAMWAVEAAYLAAWSRARPAAAPYADFVEHWTSPAFAAFVDDLEGATDRALAAAGAVEGRHDRVHEAAAHAVRETLRHEAAFWDMTVSRSGRGR